MTDALLIETPAPGIRQIRLNRPDRLNALGVDMVDALRRAVTETDARVLLIRGTGRGFCSGADLKERAGMSQESRIAHNRAINAGGGCGGCRADADDRRRQRSRAGRRLGTRFGLRPSASPATSAKIGLTEARVGVIPGAGGTQRLPRLLGTARALELMFSGEPIDAARAEIIGLVQAAIPDEDLDAHVLRYAALLGIPLTSHRPDAEAHRLSRPRNPRSPKVSRSNARPSPTCLPAPITPRVLRPSLKSAHPYSKTEVV